MQEERLIAVGLRFHKCLRLRVVETRGLNEGGVLACPSNNYDRQIYTVHDKVSIG